jgi:hypothetical protein
LTVNNSQLSPQHQQLLFELLSAKASVQLINYVHSFDSHFYFYFNLMATLCPGSGQLDLAINLLFLGHIQHLSVKWPTKPLFFKKTSLDNFYLYFFSSTLFLKRLAILAIRHFSLISD